jgi:hypothetical protein
MAEPPLSRPVPLEQTRQRVFETLAEHYAYDNLDEPQLEERLDRAARATTLEELNRLVSDLPALVEPTAVAAPGMERAAHVPDKQVIVGIMGGASRKGRWTPPRQLYVIAMMGGAELDFREARFGPGVTEVTVIAIMGGASIVVSPDTEVEMNGFALMGGFDEQVTAHEPKDPNAPVLRIGGFAMMGGVEVAVRYPGEKPGDARRREREERKELRRDRRDERRLGRGE